MRCGQGGEIIDKHKEDDIHTFTIKLVPTVSANQMLQAVIPTCEIHSLIEIVPGMNDIFIMKVNEGNEVIGTKSNYTE